DRGGVDDDEWSGALRTGRAHEAHVTRSLGGATRVVEAQHLAQTAVELTRRKGGLLVLARLAVVVEQGRERRLELAAGRSRARTCRAATLLRPALAQLEDLLGEGVALGPRGEEVPRDPVLAHHQGVARGHHATSAGWSAGTTARTGRTRRRAGAIFST